MAEYVRNARATLSPSSAEGFGLPPVESLWLGTPVVASKHIPSLEQIGSRGVCQVDPLDAAGIRAAVLSLLEPDYYSKKAAEAADLELPVWKGFAEQTAAWVTAEQPRQFMSASPSIH